MNIFVTIIPESNIFVKNIVVSEQVVVQFGLCCGDYSLFEDGQRIRVKDLVSHISGLLPQFKRNHTHKFQTQADDRARAILKILKAQNQEHFVAL